MDFRYEDIISINGIPKIYGEKEENEEKEDENKENINNEENKIFEEKNSSEDNEDEDLFNKKDYKDNCSNNDNINKDNDMEDNENNASNKDSFETQFLIQEIEDTIKYSMILFNLKLYYQFFLNFIRKIFINQGLKLLTAKVVNEEKDKE